MLGLLIELERTPAPGFRHFSKCSPTLHLGGWPAGFVKSTRVASLVIFWNSQVFAYVYVHEASVKRKQTREENVRDKFTCYKLQFPVVPSHVLTCMFREELF